MNTRKPRALIGMIRGKLHHCQRAILETDELRASPQLSPKINHMFIMSLICIQWKSSQCLFPVSTVAARNAWDPNRRQGGHVGVEEQKRFSPLATKLYFHVNSSRKIMLFLPPIWPPCHVVANQDIITIVRQTEPKMICNNCSPKGTNPSLANKPEVNNFLSIY